MRILVIEDEVKIAKAIKKGLEQESYSVDAVSDGVEGFDLAVTEEYDAVILDLMLPGMDGTEVCRKLRDSDINTPIIMLTAKSDLEDKVYGLNIGADDYLTKPFDFEELLARIKALMRRPSQALAEVLRVSDLEMNLNTMKVLRGQREIELSKKEYALLEYLMRNSGKTVTKDQILAHVWDFDSAILPNTVEQYIGYLRKKIDKPDHTEDRLIHTVRGFGYCLKV